MSAKKNSTSPSKAPKRTAKAKPDKAVVPASEPAPAVDTPTAAAGQDKQPSATTAVAEPLTVTTSDGKRVVVRAMVMNYPVTAVLRRLGKEGFDFAKARKAINAFDAGGISDTTVRIQIAAGRKGQRGEPAPLTKDQIKELASAAN